MSTFTNQVAYLKTLIEGITTDSDGEDLEPGVVYGHPIYVESIESYVVTVGGEPRIRAWEIMLDEEGITTDRLEQGFRHRRYPFAIVGYIGVEDADPTVDTDSGQIVEDDEDGTTRSPYDTLLELAELISDAIEADLTLGGTVLDMDQETTIDQPIPLTIANGALVWGVSIRFRTWRVLS